MCSLGLNMHDTYIYAFSRRFYPKRLTLHSSYSFTFYQLLLPLGIEPMILALLVPCSTIWATGKPLSYFWHHRRFGCARDMFEQIVMIDTLRNRPSAVFAGGIVQWLLWMTDREPRLWSHDSTPAVWGTACKSYISCHLMSLLFYFAQGSCREESWTCTFVQFSMTYLIYIANKTDTNWGCSQAEL